MPQPSLKQYPAEIFGYPYTELREEVQTLRQNQYCPFLKGECKKPRKSEPHIKMGVCSVGYPVEGEYLPIIVCPHRFTLEPIKSRIETDFLAGLASSEKIGWVSEVSLGPSTGSVDWVALRLDVQRQNVLDYVCVELQAAGTTGSPWQAILEHKQHGYFLQERYPYGINWANEFAKTMM